jgi:chromosome segregation ATPase
MLTDKDTVESVSTDLLEVIERTMKDSRTAIRAEEREAVKDRMEKLELAAADAANRFVKKAAEYRKLESDLADARKESAEFKRQRDVQATEIRKLKEARPSLTQAAAN